MPSLVHGVPYRRWCNSVAGCVPSSGVKPIAAEMKSSMPRVRPNCRRSHTIPAQFNLPVPPPSADDRRDGWWLGTAEVAAALHTTKQKQQVHRVEILVVSETLVWSEIKVDVTEICHLYRAVSREMFRRRLQNQCRVQYQIRRRRQAHTQPPPVSRKRAVYKQQELYCLTPHAAQEERRRSLRRRAGRLGSLGTEGAYVPYIYAATNSPVQQIQLPVQRARTRATGEKSAPSSPLHPTR